jgi:hypothetical protein
MDFKSKTLQDIKDYTGLDFETCDYFQNQLQDKSLFFDIILKQPMWLSKEYDKLVKFSKIHKIEINYAGYKRVRFYKKNN